MTKIDGHTARYYSIVGLLNLAVFGMFYAINLPVSTVYASPPAVQQVPQVEKVHTIPATQGTPVHVSVPSLAINLPVAVGSYDPASGDWTLGLTSAYYADSSMPLNNSNGTTLIYGHAQSQVFARLPDIQPDAEAIVTTDTGYMFRYNFQSSRQVEPTDVSVFTADGPPTLTLQTCIGVYSEYRALFNFKLTAIEKL